MSAAEADLSSVAEGEAPPSFICPISGAVMRDPAVCADGHSYERACIERWLSGHDTSPKTNARLAHRQLTPNHTLRNSIEEFLERTLKTTTRAAITIAETIGAGSSKTVHAGTLRGHPGRVAVLKMRMGADLRAEVKALVKLGRHPNLVRFLGVCTEGQGAEPLLITELAPLGALDAFLADREGQVGVAHKTVMVAQVCHGMSALAEQGLIHRDVAARNVLVFEYAASSPRATLVKVSDFGLAVSAYGATHQTVAGEQVPFRRMPPVFYLQRAPPS